jgi:hypothetical protein
MAEIVTWKVVSPTSYLWKERKRFMKPGEVFKATEDELPEGLKRVVVPIARIHILVPEKPKITPVVKEVEVVKPVVEVIPEPVQVEFKEHVGKDYPTVEAVPQADKMRYRVKERNGGEYWDVLDSNGKIMNEQHLDRDEAFDMLKSLRG